MLSDRIRHKINSLSGQPWMPHVCLAAITLLAAVLRFFKLGEWSFWIDEIHTINHAASHFSSTKLILEHIPPVQKWIPISVILTAQSMNLWGINEWNARLTSVLIGLLSIPILYVSVKKPLGNRATLLAMFLLALSPWHIFWSQNARFYTTLMLFYSLALLVFYFSIEHDRPVYLIVFYILFYFAMSERLIAVLLMPVIVVYLLSLWLLPFEKPPGFNLRNLLVLSTPIILFLIYEVYLFAATGDFVFAYDIALLAPPIDSPTRLLILIAFSIGMPTLCMGLLSSMYFLLKRERLALFLTIAAILPPILLAAGSAFVFTVERYAFMTLPFWIFLAARGLNALFGVVGKREFVLALGALFIFIADAAGEGLLYYQINHGNRLNWREAVEYVDERKQEGDIVISTRGRLASYYLGEDVLEFQDMRPVDMEGMDAPIWFIIDYPGVWHGRLDSKDWMEKHAQLLQYSYLRVREGISLQIYYLDPEPASSR